MASLPGDELCCPVCQDIFKDPVRLSCDHSFCKVCLEGWWSERPERECPACKRKSSKEEPPVNLALRNRCDPLLEHKEQGPRGPRSPPTRSPSSPSSLSPWGPSSPPSLSPRSLPGLPGPPGPPNPPARSLPTLSLPSLTPRSLPGPPGPPSPPARSLPTLSLPSLTPRSLPGPPGPPTRSLPTLTPRSLPSPPSRTPLNDLCGLHSEKLRLFCVDHQELVCLVCRDAERHSGHRLRPLDEAAQQHKEQLQETLQPLKDKLKVRREVQTKLEDMAQYVRFQVDDTEKQIRETFRWIHQFLKEEEEARIDALREEEQLKSRLTKEKMEALTGEMDALSLTIRDTEEQLRAGDVSFLHGYKDAVARVRRCPLLDDPQLHAGALIDQAKHLDNLSYNIWQKMKDLVSFSPVVLDPNTAHPELVLAEDLTAVTHGDVHKVPANPERFDPFCAVLASEGFHSGAHSWDVRVGPSERWRLGVAAESVHRKEAAPSQLWGILLDRGQYRAEAPPTFSEVLPMAAKPGTIRVTLKWSEGKLSFSDVDSGAEIHAFTHTFTETMFPFVSSGDEHALKILPLKLSAEPQRMLAPPEPTKRRPTTPDAAPPKPTARRPTTPDAAPPEPTEAVPIRTRPPKRCIIL